MNKRLKGRRWIDLYPKVLKQYNTTKHSSVGMTPTKASKKENENEVFLNIYGGGMDKKWGEKWKKVNFSVGDVLRIPQVKWRHTKGYKPNWTQEVFRVKRIRMTKPPSIFLEDKFGKEILGSFYPEELQKSKQKFEREEVVRIVKPRKRLTAQKGEELVETESKRKTERDRRARAKE